MVTAESLRNREDRIAIIGLGYVGLPLAVHLARHYEVVGYDLDPKRVRELTDGHDRTLEATDEELAGVDVQFTDDPAILSQCRLIIVAVPTPIDRHRIPDLVPLRGASETAGRRMSPGSCVVFESTVFPGATEEICVPIMERESGLRLGADFTVGYSPERINPGDREHSIDSIVKIVSGWDEATADLLTEVYGTVVKAGLHRASSIRVAEAAKVIENTQRDLNIALMNELAMIFERMGIDTQEVLAAAATKWNFLPFRPGLVGGHCIGVDPYYLTFKAESLGYHPDMILAGRRINDGMGKFIAERTVKMMIRLGKQVRGARMAVLGLAFKEDVPDLRNTRVVDIIHELEDYGIEVMTHDPLADPEEAEKYFGIRLRTLSELNGVDGVILAVTHRTYRDMGLPGIAQLCSTGSSMVIDVKSAFSPAEAKALNIRYWRL
ncbi:MAG: nucleotide sugar dehydrogenase [Desulfococcaceae bacterium]